MNNPFNYTPDAECREAFRKLLERIEELKKSRKPEDVNFCHELEAGKMLGVLIALDEAGNHQTLYAFSGQLGDAGFHYPGFVGPVFDYLRPDGYFKRAEGAISRLNAEIAGFEKGELGVARRAFEDAEARGKEEIGKYKEKCRVSRLERERKRETCKCDESEIAGMVRQSQFEKAELGRLKKRIATELDPYRDSLEEKQHQLEAMKDKRRKDSEALQRWLFSNFRLLNAKGETLNLTDIFAGTRIGVPPSGAGECCGPKLLQAAYLRGWRPMAIAEYWYGKPKGGEVRIHGEHYPACRGKCLPILRRMLEGLKTDPPLEKEDYSYACEEPRIVFENQWFCVVDKPSGMLSVRGKGRALSVEEWLEERYGREKAVKVAHRLDQDTSGLLIASFGAAAYKEMQSLFARRKIKKTYEAVLQGDYEAKGVAAHGRIDLPLSPDWLDRPRQRIDYEEGKEAVTDYEFTGVRDGKSRVALHPQTGRTHQLRVHAASGDGLGMPIVGDRLYGVGAAGSRERLHLHAKEIEFEFPIDGGHYKFESPVPF